MKKIIFYSFSIAAVLFLFICVSANAQTTNLSYPIAELGNCKDQQACKLYCDDSAHMSACIDFGEARGLMSKEEAAIGKKAAERIAKGETPGGCKDKTSCETFCQNNINDLQQCISFAEDVGINQGDIAQAKQIAAALQKGASLPGECTGKQSCETYCKDTAHIDECLVFAEVAQIIPAEEIAQAKKVAPFLKKGETPGKCKAQEECKNYCKDESHFEECLTFAEKAELVSKEDAELARKTGGKGPGGCNSKESCETFCDQEENAKTCADFATENKLMGEEELKAIKEGPQKIKDGLEKVPSEMKTAVESCLNTLFNGNLNAVLNGEKTLTKSQGEKVGNCFESAAKDYAAQQGAQSGASNMTQPPSKEEINSMMQGAPESMKEEIEANIQQKIQEEVKNRTPQNIPPAAGTMPSGAGTQGAPCSSEAECRAMFGGGPPAGIPR